MRYIIKDWTGAIKFRGQEFNDFEDAISYLTSYLDDIGIDPNEIDAYLDEYQVVEIERE